MNFILYRPLHTVPAQNRYSIACSVLSTIPSCSGHTGGFRLILVVFRSSCRYDRSIFLCLFRRMLSLKFSLCYISCPSSHFQAKFELTSCPTAMNVFDEACNLIMISTLSLLFSCSISLSLPYVVEYLCTEV